MYVDWLSQSDNDLESKPTMSRLENTAPAFALLVITSLPDG